MNFFEYTIFTIYYTGWRFVVVCCLTCLEDVQGGGSLLSVALHASGQISPYHFSH